MAVTTVVVMVEQGGLCLCVCVLTARKAYLPFEQPDR